MRILIVLGLSAAAMSAQQRTTPVMSVPVMGLIAGAGPAEVRPLVGLPGSAITGDAVLLPDAVRRVHLAPGQGSALVERIGTPVAVVSFNGAAAGDVSEIAGAMSRPDLVAFSPRGGWAVLHAAQGGRMQVIALTGGTGRVTTDFVVDGVAGIRQIAIDDTGATVVATTDDGGVYVVGNRAPQMIFRGGAITDAAFMTGTSTLVVADAPSGQISRIDGLPNGNAVVTMASGLDNDGQLWLRSSTDGKFVFAAGSGRRTAWRIEVAGGAPRTVQLQEDAAGLVRLGNGNTFVYSAAAGAPVWLLLGDDPDLRTIFAPGFGATPRRSLR